MSSNTQKSTDAMGVDSEASKPTTPGDVKRLRSMKGSDTSASISTNDPSSTSAAATARTARQLTEVQEVILPTLPEAAAAASPAIPRVERKKPPRDDQFVKKLRLLLDRESQMGSTIVRWSADGNSFIIMDQDHFEAQTIPTYFGNPIVFASFVRKLYRYGFNRVPSRLTGYYEFSSPTFRTLVAGSGIFATNMPFTNAAGVGASINPTHTQAPLLQPVVQTNLPLPPPDLALNFNAALNKLAAGQTSLSQLLGNPPHPPQNNAINTLLSLAGLPAQSTFINTSTAAIPPSNAVVQSLLTLMNQLREQERQRRAQADAVRNAILAALQGNIGRGGNLIDEGERQGGVSTALGQTLGGTHNINPVQNQPSMPPWQSADNLNFQATNPIAAILQAARRGEAEQLIQEYAHHAQNDKGNNAHKKYEAQPPSQGAKRKSADVDQYDADDDSGEDRLRPNKK